MAESGRKMKKVPLRKCVGCMQSFEKKDLIRVVRSPEGEVSLDFGGKKSGRGAYICKDAKCLKKAQKSRRIDKSLDTEIPDEVYERLAEELEGGRE